MFGLLTGIASSLWRGISGVAAAIPLGIKGIKYFIDSNFRDQVTPKPGSVLYCDLWLGAEHSGIYVGDQEIANIEVTDVAEGTVNRCGPASFTSKSKLGRKIYVSCDSDGAVGCEMVSDKAVSHIGDRGFYGLVFANCHVFSARCVKHSPQSRGSSWFNNLLSKINIFDESWELTIKALKESARYKLGATKWRLWDWDGSLVDNPTPEPDWQTLEDHLKNQPLNEEVIAALRAELAECKAYEAELADEGIPDEIRKKLAGYGQLLGDIDTTYEKAKPLLTACSGANFSYHDLKLCHDDIEPLAKQLQQNRAIKELVHKMGRAYISEEKKKQARIPQASKSEVHGTHRSDDLARVLPTELLNLEDEALETLFYARFLERNLMTYELQGTTFTSGELLELEQKRTGPVVACLDTSGSMNGTPLLKARALLLAVSAILQQERRSLHVLLFGDSGEVREFAMTEENNAAGLLHFLRQGFGGGTDFETPLKRACEIIGQDKGYEKADILMISDGDCVLSEDFIEHLHTKKRLLDCSVYSVLCHGQRVADSFSDEDIVL
ncbi:VWA domain-containing protein [Aeromonas veronii]|uniref:VWA domain-containing protein n=1 Tax=Aeromonas veronii TaxID=654 RepID=UPI003005B49A